MKNGRRSEFPDIGVFGGTFISMKPQVIKEQMKSFASRGKVIKLTIIISMALMVAVITGALYFRSTVYITDGGTVKELKTNETNLENILSDAEIELYEGDVASLLNDNDKIYIDIKRAFDVTVNADKKTKKLRMTDGNVSDALSKAGIRLGEDDIVSEDLNALLYSGITINVTRIKYANRDTWVDVPYETEYVDNPNLKIGTQKLISSGKKGIKTIVYKDLFIDGEYVSSEKLGEEITKEPVNEVVGVGSSLQVPYAKLDDDELDKVKLVNGRPENYVKVVSGKATAYSAKAGSLTASGRYAVVGTVAVNPNIIPYGSELYIVAQNGKRVYGYAVAADTGVGLLDGRVTVDVFMGSYADSCKWGAVYVDVYVLKMGDNRYIGAKERNATR